MGKKKLKPRDILLIVLIIMALGVAGWLAYHFYGEFKADSLYTDLQNDDKDKLVKEYDNMIGWLTIEDTVVDYPVVRTFKDNPNFYLDHDINGEWSVNGCLFVDPSSDLVESYNTIIYGHHMANGSMFNMLTKYKYQKFADTHDTAIFTKWFSDGTYDKGEYKLYAAYGCSVKDEWSYLDFVNITDEKTFNDYVKTSKEKSEIKSDVKPKYGDDMITLSTCSYHIWRWGRVSDDGRFVAVFVKDNHEGTDL